MVAVIILLGLVWSEFSSLVRRNLASAVEWLLIVTDCQILDPRLSVVTPLELCLFKHPPQLAWQEFAIFYQLYFSLPPI